MKGANILEHNRTGICAACRTLESMPRPPGSVGIACIGSESSVAWVEVEMAISLLRSLDGKALWISQLRELPPSICPAILVFESGGMAFVVLDPIACTSPGGIA
jgi:hypothetical protein